jgi:serine/threonine protein kinase
VGSAAAMRKGHRVLLADKEISLAQPLVKPANIMITQDDQIKVLDFGIAKLTTVIGTSPDLETRAAIQGTIPGVVIGTAAYMSPEQTRGEPVDARSAIFSLGCVLYQAATGKRPFGGASTLAIMHEIATLLPPAPSSLRSELPGTFDTQNTESGETCRYHCARTERYDYRGAETGSHSAGIVAKWAAVPGVIA